MKFFTRVFKNRLFILSLLITLLSSSSVFSQDTLKFESAYAKAKVKVSFAQTLDETAKLADYVCPDNNFLESWGDANPKRGHYSLQQPTIKQIFSAPRYEGTRQVQDTLLKWSAIKADYLTYLQGYWNTGTNVLNI